MGEELQLDSRYAANTRYIRNIDNFRVDLTHFIIFAKPFYATIATPHRRRSHIVAENGLI
jgi:hypothetical protein